MLRSKLAHSNTGLFIVLVGLLGALFAYFQYHEHLHQLFFVVFLLFLGIPIISQLKSLQKFYWLIVFLAPLSVSVELPGGFSLKAPLELLVITLSGAYLLKWSQGLKVPKFNWRHPLVLLLIADLLWTLIASLNSSLLSVSIKRFVLNALFLFGFFFLFQQTVKNNQQRLYKLYGLGALLPILLISIRHAYYGFSQNTSFIMSQPFFDDHTQYGACIAFVIPYFLLHVKREKGISWRNIIISLILLFAVITSYSRAAWISLIVAFLLYFLLKIKMKFHTLMTIMVGLIIIGSLNFSHYYDSLKSTEVKYADDVSQHLTSVTNLQNDASNLERINRWVCAYRMFKDRPLFGFGPGTYQFVYDQYQTTEFMTRISTHKGDKGNAHSEILNRLSEQGIVSAILYLVILLYVLFFSMKTYYLLTDPGKKKLLLASFLGLTTFYIHGLFNTFTDIAEMSLLIYGSLAILLLFDTNEIQRKA